MSQRALGTTQMQEDGRGLGVYGLTRLGGESPLEVGESLLVGVGDEGFAARDCGVPHQLLRAQCRLSLPVVIR